MASVTISRLEKSYGSLAVMHGVDVDIEDGEFVILVGPFGLRQVHVAADDRGPRDHHRGRDRHRPAARQRARAQGPDIAMVFQNYALYPQMTVAQNMGFALELAGKRRAEIQAEVARAAEILSLTPLLTRKPAQLSGGQRQRVAMGRAIVRNPKVFLFDEPLSNLDAKLRVQMRAEIKALHRRLRSTIVYVTHDQIEAMTMADKIVVMNAGRVEQVGRPLDLYDRPANLFVAQFIGSPAMNILPASVGPSGRLRLADGSEIAALSAALLAPDQEVRYGLRPRTCGWATGCRGAWWTSSPQARRPIS
jgi:multiple sugar transport system ATP-binding protein